MQLVSRSASHVSQWQGKCTQAGICSGPAPATGPTAPISSNVAAQHRQAAAQEPHLHHDASLCIPHPGRKVLRACQQHVALGVPLQPVNGVTRTLQRSREVPCAALPDLYQTCSQASELECTAVSLQCRHSTTGAARAWTIRLSLHGSPSRPPVATSVPEALKATEATCIQLAGSKPQAETSARQAGPCSLCRCGPAADVCCCRAPALGQPAGSVQVC